MNAKAEDKAAAPALDDARTDKEKLTDIGLSDEEAAALEDKDDGGSEDDKGESGKDADASKEEGDDATKGADQTEDEDEDADPAPAKAKVPDHFIPIAETLVEKMLSS